MKTVEEMITRESVTEDIAEWLNRVVIGLNLCPFARKPFKQGLVRITVDLSEELEGFLESFFEALHMLRESDIGQVETVLLVTPNLFGEFDDYLDMLELCEGIIRDKGLEGDFQIASFHPDYCFSGVESDDQSNYTNRSPYPLFHLLREESISNVKAVYPNVESIPEVNIEKLRGLSPAELKEYFSRLKI